jgi:hypothetical protein
MLSRGSGEILKVVVLLFYWRKPIFFAPGPTGKAHCRAFEMPMTGNTRTIRPTEEREKAACIRVILAIAANTREASPFAGDCSHRKNFRRRL